jgi:Tol biopolymer transport system component
MSYPSLKHASTLLLAASALGLAAEGAHGVLAAGPERILFSSNRADPDKFNVYSVGPEGGIPKQLSKGEAREFDPSLSPDGTHIACVVLGSPQMPLTDVYVMDADGKNRKRLTQGGAMAFEPQWSPDGKQISYSTLTPAPGAAPKAQVMVVGVDGKNGRQVGEGLFPSWSHDGKRLLYTTMTMVNGMVEPQLHSMNVDGTEDKRVGEGVAIMAQYSPDGKQIVFMGDGGNNQPDLWVMNADGTGRKQITKTEDIEIGPLWSADGKRIFFTRTPRVPQNPPKSKIMAIDADGKNEKAITGGEALDLTGGAFLFMQRGREQPAGK